MKKKVIDRIDHLRFDFSISILTFDTVRHSMCSYVLVISMMKTNILVRRFYERDERIKSMLYC